MKKSLFDKIHDDSRFYKRTEPATAEEFIEHGLELKDYVQYVGLLLCLQGELLLYGAPKADIFLTEEKTQKTTYPSVERLLNFCKEKNLISQDEQINDPWYYSNMFHREDAEYFHAWLRYPKDPTEFRLTIERKLSLWWDEEDVYIADTFGIISFSHEDYFELPDGSRVVEVDSPIRIKRFNTDTNDYTILDRTEVQKIFEIAQREKNAIESEVSTHLAQKPLEHEDNAIAKGLPWIKKLYTLSKRQEIIEHVFDMIQDAISTQNVYKFKESDVLFVFCGEDTCKENHHLQVDMKVEFSFYGKPNRQYTIKRCSHCKQFQISLKNLIAMFDNHGVPLANIVYDDDGPDFSQFPETSKLYEIGYSVSQSVGLSAAQRQNRLKNAIDAGKVSKQEALTFLSRRISINGMKSGNELALRKWKEDYEFVRNL